MVKNLLPMQETQETQVRSRGREVPLDKEMATHSSILACKNPMDRGACQVTVHGVTKRWTWLKQVSTHTEAKGTCIFMKGLGQRKIQHRIRAKVDRIQALADWSLEGQYHHVCHLHGGLCSWRTQKHITMHTPWRGNRTLPYHHTIVWLPFLCPCIPLFSLRSLITETCSRASTVAKFRSENDIGKNWFSYVKKVIPGSFSLGTP